MTSTTESESEPESERDRSGERERGSRHRSDYEPYGAPSIDDLKKYFRKDWNAHPNKQEAFEKAFGIITSKRDFVRGDYFRGAGKAIQAIVNNTLRVFISYKFCDDKSARTLRKHIRALGGDGIQVFLAEDSMKGSDPLHARVKDEIHLANWFVLVLPRKTLDWDWVLYETGMYRGTMKPGDRLICLRYQYADRPRQIIDLKDFGSTEGEISRFLQEMLVEEDAVPGLKPINTAALPLIPTAARKIARDFSPDTKRSHQEAVLRLILEQPERLCRYRDLSPENQKLVDLRIMDTPASDRETQRLRELLRWNEEVINEAKIVAPLHATSEGFSLCLNLFGKTGARNFKELVSKLADEEQDKTWIAELCVAMRDVVDNDIINPIQGMFKAATPDRSFVRTVLYIADRRDDGSVEAFQLLFLKEPLMPSFDHSKVEEVVNGYGQLAVSLRLGHRFRYEVVERFKDLEDLPQVATMEQVINQLLTEATTVYGLKLDKLSEFFKEKKDRGRVDKLYKQFMALLETLRVAIKKNDLEAIRKLLKGFAPVNQDYLTVATKLFAEMNAELVQKSQ